MADPLAALLIVLGVLVGAVAVIGTVATGSAYEEIGRRKLAVGLEQDQIDAARARSRADASLQGAPSEAQRLALAEEGWALEDPRTAELRQLLVARNERRLRRGQEPLEVESELQRLLASDAELQVAPEDRV